jgi:hypothetical protein
MSSVTLGKGLESQRYITIDDIARQSGLYLLGRPGMGKSALAIFTALQDITRGHGVFFLDPHGDAVVDLARRLKEDDLKRTYLFDPEDDDYSFGINLLHCPNLKSLKARTDTYTRAYNVFFKLWEDNWGPWLQLILQNVLLAFIENQEYTLADVPMFLNPHNTAFREHIIDNITHSPEVADFWRFEFFESRRRDQVQQERIDAALTRLNILLTHRYVRDIVGQQQSTIDFEQVVSTKDIFLFRLPANLAEDIKKFIGTILLRELLHAVRARREGARDQFCIFLDEFHNFASDDSMATMITEGRKFGIASTYMHVERFGQLANNPKLMGATAATVNKGFFQLTVKDAEEFAPEFAREVEATEPRREAELVISPRPVEDIWEKGHPEEWVSYTRQQYFWLVDLLRKHAQDTYLTFDSVRIPPYRKESKIEFPKWDEFDDWELYRATPQMLETGISLLNQYYYDWMQKKYTRKKPATDAEIDLALKVIECFAGVLGLRPTMIPYIPDIMRLSIVKRVQEIREREIESQQRMNEELRRLGLEDRIPRHSSTMRSLALNEVPTNLLLQNVPLWKENALHVGFSTHEIEQFIQWKVRPYVYFEQERLRALIEDGLNEGFANPTVNNEYHGIMLHEVFERKNIDPDPLDGYSPIMQKFGGRVIWQRGALQLVIAFLFKLVPEALMENPVKIPSTKYDESLRVDRPQHDLVTDMVLELSRLPRFHAYAKITQGEDNGIYKMHTLALPRVKDLTGELQAIENGYTLCKKRDDISIEIRERQNRWLGRLPPGQRGIR